MTRIAELTDKATRLRSESTAFTYNELSGDDLPLEELAGLWVSAQEWATAARAVEKAIAQELVDRLGDSHESVTASGYLVWLGAATKEECIDPVGFVSWLEQNPSEIGKAVNPNSVRKGSIPIVVRETFFEKTLVGEARMQAVPVEVLAARKKT